MFAALFLSLAPCQAPAEKPLPGRAMIDNYFRLQVKQISDACLTNLTTKSAWERDRPEMRRQFLEMMGLWPMPEKTDLKATITGTAEGDGFTVENLHFQSRPGLYVTANVYKPKPALPGKLPTILYVCGHGNTVENGVSYGSKVTYQYHPAWFAKHGYVCIILDTLQLGEIKGEHHGTYRLNQWWWQSRGYTPGGVELWNAIRALDYLETRPDVDMKKIGVTGRSGGGATSWWVAAADDRPAAIAPIAGIADLESHVCKGFTERLKAGVIAGHCDCMYMVNTYRWDFAQVAALAAPRPLLLGNSDEDDIFPMPGYRSIAKKVRKVYDLYGEGDRFELLETKGPHKDTPELRIGINRFFNRYLKGDTTTKVEDDLPSKLPSTALKVLKETPKDAINERIAETFVAVAKPMEFPSGVPDIRSWWSEQTIKIANRLFKQSFAGWSRQPMPTVAKLANEVTNDGLRLRVFDFDPEPGIALRIYVATIEKEEPKRIELEVVDERGWAEWCESFDIAYSKILPPSTKPNRDKTQFAKRLASLKGSNLALAVIAPRGIGPTKWAEPGTTDETHIRRRFALLGQTLEGQRISDVYRTTFVITKIPDLEKSELILSGTGLSASIAMYAGVVNPYVKSLKLYDLPTTHANGAILINADKVIHSPQLAIVLIPKITTIIVKNERAKKEWDWVIDFAKRVGTKPPTIHVKE